MELRQLRYVVAIAEEGSFTGAARRCSVAQPALSQQIRRLEAELGVSLFDRTSRRVAITDAGSRIVHRARRAIAEIDDAAQEIAQVRGLHVGQVTVGITSTPGPVDVVGLLAAFHSSHPEIRLVVREQLSADITAGVAADQLDLGIVTRHAGLPTDVELVSVASEPLVVVLPRHHALEARASVRLADLGGLTLIAFPPRATIRSTLAFAAEQAGVSLRIGFEIQDPARVRALAAAGLGVAVVPASEAGGPLPGLEVRPLEPPLRHEVHACWRRGRGLTPAASALLDAVRLST